MEVRELNKDDVLFFILKNKDNKALMAELNRITYAFTAKYENWRQNKTKTLTISDIVYKIDVLKEFLNDRRFPLWKIINMVSEKMLEDVFSYDIYELENFLRWINSIVKNYSEYDIEHYDRNKQDNAYMVMDITPITLYKWWDRLDTHNRIATIFEYLEDKYIIKHIF